MRRGPNRQDRPPRVGAAVLAKALLGVLLIFVSTGAASAGAGYFQSRSQSTRRSPARRPTPIPISRGRRAAAGARRAAHAPRARLRPPRQARDGRQARAGAALGHDRARSGWTPKRNRIAVLSLPRDLAVTIPGYADGVKINQAYDEGGAGADAEDRQAPVRERDGRAVRGQQRHRRQLQRLPARGQLRQGRLRRRRPQVLQPARAPGSRRSTSRPATSGWSARTRSPTCATGTPTATSSATPASRTSCARRPSRRSASSRARRRGELVGCSSSTSASTGSS